MGRDPGTRQRPVGCGVTAPTLDRATAAEQGRQLVARHQAGDPHAYAEIYTRYRGDVQGFIYRRVQDRELAEDLTHDVFTRALRHIGRWQWQGKDVGAWLITIARNIVIDHIRNVRNRYEVHNRYEVTPGEFGDTHIDETPEGDPETTVLNHLRNVALLTALLYLS